MNSQRKNQSEAFPSNTSLFLFPTPSIISFIHPSNLPTKAPTLLIQHCTHTSHPTLHQSDFLFHSRSQMLKDTDDSSSSYNQMISYSNIFHVWKCLWIPLIVVFFSKAFCNSNAQSILLPHQDRSFLRSAGVSSCPMPDPSLYFRPVVGILTHPGDGASGRLNNATNASYIAASYVKFVESAGARVIPLIYNEPKEILAEKLNLVNGVLFTGGRAKTGLYYETVQELFKQALEKNDAGYHFPVLATCLGFELLNMIVSEDKNILETFNALDQASTLQFMGSTNIEGTVFQRFSPDLLKKLTTECLVMQNHHYGISPKRFLETPALSSFFKILTTSKDRNDKVYVSTVQAQNYPITGFQWHPEKNAFEWGLSMIPHSEDAVQVTQHVANYFISEARKSMNRPSARKVLDNLIYNYSPTYCGKAGKGYDEVYIFT